MARLLEFLVPGVGIEPTTQGSSGLRSTTELSRLVIEFDTQVYPFTSSETPSASTYLSVRLGFTRFFLVTE